MTPLAEIPERILKAIEIGFKNLLAYDVAFMPMSMTILFIIFLVLVLVFFHLIKINKRAKVSILILLCGVILVSQTHIILAKTIADYGGTNYYGLLFLRVLIVALAFKFCVKFANVQKLTHNLLFILSAILIWVCVVQDLYAQRVQKLAIDDELRLLNRVIDRLEQNENFSYNKQYYGIIIGNFPNMREKHYSDSKYKSNLSLLNHLFFVDVNFGAVASTLISKNVFGKHPFFASSAEYEKKIKNKDFLLLISRLHKAGILDKLKPFPHKDSIVVFEDIIVFVASKGNLDEIRQMAKTLDNKGALQ